MKLYPKDCIQKYIKTFGFTDIDDVAYTKLNLIIDTLMRNILENAVFVMEMNKAKTLTPKTFMIIMHLLHLKQSNPKNTVMSGGGPVLPPAYFGKADPSYTDAASFTDLTNTSDFRAALPAYSAAIEQIESQSGGGKKGTVLITVECVQEYVNKFKKDKNKEFRISKKSYAIIAHAVQQNLNDLILDVSKLDKSKKKVLTQTILFNTLKKNLYKYIHMSTVWN